MPKKRFLVTGGNGNLARQVVSLLGPEAEELVLFDMAPPQSRAGRAKYVQGDIAKPGVLRGLFKRHRPTHVLHFASLLSGRSEEDRPLAWRINATSTFEMLELSVEHGVERFFFPSTTATYGSGLADPLPEDFPQWPENLYGATKVAIERLGFYYRKKHGLDFRCVRLPLVISRFAPSGAVSAYASHAFVEAAAGRKYVFPVNPSSAASCVYVKDVVRGIHQLLSAPARRLTRPAYNLHAFSAAAGDVAAAIKKRIPGFEWAFRPKRRITRLIDTWAKVHVDESARRDWGWAPRFDLDATADDLIEELRAQP